MMQLPIIKPAPIVTAHSAAFRHLFKNRSQFQHFEHYLTGLIALDHKTMANMTRCIINSPDKTNLSRFFSSADWSPDEVNEERLTYMLQQTRRQRLPARKSVLAIDDTLCEHVGNLFEHIDRHYNHGNNTYPLAHNLVTGYYVSGAVRFPTHGRLYRRNEEFTGWETFVKKHFPEAIIPTRRKARHAFKKQVAATLLADPEFKRLNDAFQTKIDLATELVEAAIEQELPFHTVLFDTWYLSPALRSVLETHDKKWISLLKMNRNIETNNLQIIAETGEPVEFDKPKIKLSDLVPLIPASAFRAVAGDLRLSYAQFEELEAFARFGTRLDEETRRTLERGRRVREILKQPQYEIGRAHV